MPSEDVEREGDFEPAGRAIFAALGASAMDAFHPAYEHNADLFEAAAREAIAKAPPPDPATWARYEALRDSAIVVQGPRKDMAALDAFVRGLLTRATRGEGGGQGRPMCPRDLDELDGLAHELWASAQLVPGEGILHGVYRIIEVLAREYGVTEFPADKPR